MVAALPAQAPRKRPVDIDWRVSPGLVAYQDAVAEMEARVAAIRTGEKPELIWCLEHPPLYTAGTSAETSELLDIKGLPVYRTGRGGRTTWHGPGQRVAYVMLDLRERGSDVRAFVRDLEDWVIATLGRFGISGERRDGRVGIWVPRGAGEEKIAAIGVRVRRWVSYHGIAINLAPDLGHFAGIVPCGLAGFGVTSLKALGVDATMADLDRALRTSFEDVFGRSTVPESAGKRKAQVPIAGWRWRLNRPASWVYKAIERHPHGPERRRWRVGPETKQKGAAPPFLFFE